MKPSLSTRELQTVAVSLQSSSPGTGCVPMVSLYLGHSLLSNVLRPRFVPQERRFSLLLLFWHEIASPRVRSRQRKFHGCCWSQPSRTPPPFPTSTHPPKMECRWRCNTGRKRASLDERMSLNIPVTDGGRKHKKFPSP